MRQPKKRPSQVNSVLESSFSHLGLASKIKEYNIRKNWPSIVGEQVSRRVFPEKLINTTLYCRVSSAPWMAELNYQKNSIIENINIKLGGQVVTALVLKCGEVSPENKKRQTPVAVAPRPLGEDDKKFIEKTVSRISDPALRSAVKRAMEKAKA